MAMFLLGGSGIWSLQAGQRRGAANFGACTYDVCTEGGGLANF